MNNYYLLSWKHNPELASAIYRIESQVAYELIPQLEGKSSMPLDFELKRIRETKEGIITDSTLDSLNEIWLDYLPNSLAWPLMSERMKSAVENNLTGNEGIDWIACKIKGCDEERPYFILRFNKILDVLDMQKTMFVQGTDHIIKPVFSSSKVLLYNIFSRPSSHDLWKITSGLYVSEPLKKAIQKQKLTGIEFEKTSVS